jgi:hypothetical protein
MASPRPRASTEAYQVLISKFDGLLGSCDDLLIAFSTCHSTSAEGLARQDSRGSKCIPQQRMLESCLISRHERGQKIASGRCKTLYSTYENCMHTTPDFCAETLAALFVCAEKDLGVPGPSSA